MNTTQIYNQINKYQKNHKMVFVEGETLKGARIQRTGFIYSIRSTSNGKQLNFLDNMAGGMSSIKIDDIKTIKRAYGTRK